MTSYYASLDESQAALSTPAAALVKGGDITGFFDACGMYYVRSINRRSRYVSVFEFESSSREEAAAFSAELEAEIKGWGQKVGAGGELGRDTAQSASRRKLTITASAWGLGKAESDGLVSYDLETFRKSVKAAFAATQEDDVGKVISIEIVPWTEYAEFQALLLGQGTRGAAKRNLLVNAEFLAEVDRAARTRLNAFYGAKQCRAQIDVQYRRVTPDASKWRTSHEAPGVAYDKFFARNHRIPTDRSLTIKELYEAVRPSVQQLLYDEYDAFMYGGKDDLPRIVQNGVETVHGRFAEAERAPPSAQRRAWLDQATVTFLGLLGSPPKDARTNALLVRLIGGYYARVRGAGIPAAADLAALTAWYEDAAAAERRLAGAATTAELAALAVEDAFNVSSFVADSELGWWQAAAGGLLDALPYRARAETRLPEEEAVAALLDQPMRAYLERVLQISLTKAPAPADLNDANRPAPPLPAAGYDALLAFVNSESFANLKRARPAREIAVNTLMALLRSGTIDGVGAPLDSALDVYAVTRLVAQMREFHRDVLAEEVERYVDAHLHDLPRWTQIRGDAALAGSRTARITALLAPAEAGAEPAYRALPPPTAAELPGFDPATPLASLERAVAQDLFTEYRRHGTRPGRRSLGALGFFASGEFVGAARCVDALLADGRLLVDSYRNIEVCQRVESQLSTMSSRIIDDHCMPRALPPPKPKPPAPAPAVTPAR
jgi:hypothetical protein